MQTNMTFLRALKYMAFSVCYNVKMSPKSQKLHSHRKNVVIFWRWPFLVLYTCKLMLDRAFLCVDACMSLLITVSFRGLCFRGERISCVTIHYLVLNDSKSRLTRTILRARSLYINVEVKEQRKCIRNCRKHHADVIQ